MKGWLAILALTARIALCSPTALEASRVGITEYNATLYPEGGKPDFTGRTRVLAPPDFGAKYIDFYWAETNSSSVIVLNPDAALVHGEPTMDISLQKRNGWRRITHYDALHCEGNNVQLYNFGCEGVCYITTNIGSGLGTLSGKLEQEWSGPTWPSVDIFRDDHCREFLTTWKPSGQSRSCHNIYETHRFTWIRTFRAWYSC